MPSSTCWNCPEEVSSDEELGPLGKGGQGWGCEDIFSHSEYESAFWVGAKLMFRRVRAPRRRRPGMGLRGYLEDHELVSSPKLFRFLGQSWFKILIRLIVVKI